MKPRPELAAAFLRRAGAGAGDGDDGTLQTRASVTVADLADARVGDLARANLRTNAEARASVRDASAKRVVIGAVRSMSHWSPYDRVRVVNAVP